MAKAIEVEEGQILVFPNKFKKADKEPDYRAHICVDGTQLEFGVWKRTSKKDGSSYLGGTVSEGTPQKATKVIQDDDDFPF